MEVIESLLIFTFLDIKKILKAFSVTFKEAIIDF
jgi:hypothetical protein